MTGIQNLHGKIDDTRIELRSSGNSVAINTVELAGSISGGTFNTVGRSVSGVDALHGTISGGEFFAQGVHSAFGVNAVRDNGIISGGKFTATCTGTYGSGNGAFGVRTLHGTISGGEFRIATSNVGAPAYGVNTVRGGGIISGDPMFSVNSPHDYASGVTFVRDNGNISGGKFTVTGSHASGIGSGSTEYGSTGMYDRAIISGGEFCIIAGSTAVGIQRINANTVEVSGGIFWSKGNRTAFGIRLVPSTFLQVVLTGGTFNVWGPNAASTRGINNYVPTEPIALSCHMFMFLCKDERHSKNANAYIISNGGTTFFEIDDNSTCYTIDGTVGPNGSINPTLPHAVAAGDSVTFAITPNPGYVIESLTVDGTVITPTNTVSFPNVNANHMIEVTFKEDLTPSYTITPLPVSNGSISPSAPQTVAAGGSVTFTITPASGYVLDVITVNGMPVEPTTMTPAITYVFTNVNADHTIGATFELDEPSTKYTIITYGKEGGIAVPTGIWEVDEGQEIIISFDSMPGYRLAEIRVNGALEPLALANKYIRLIADQDYEIVAVGNRFTPVGPTGDQVRVEFNATPLTVTVLSPVTFTPNSIGMLYPEFWLWDFGDGNSNKVMKNSAEPVTHVYTMPGIYTPSLTGINGYFSGTESKIGYITVEAKMK